MAASASFRLGREDPLLELMAGGRIVFDDRDLEHGAFSRTACRKYPRFLRSKHSRRVSVCSHDGRNGNAAEEILTAREQTDPASALNLPRRFDEHGLHAEPGCGPIFPTPRRGSCPSRRRSISGEKPHETTSHPSRSEPSPCTRERGCRSNAPGGSLRWRPEPWLLRPSRTRYAGRYRLRPLRLPAGAEHRLRRDGHRPQPVHRQFGRGARRRRTGRSRPP